MRTWKFSEIAQRKGEKELDIHKGNLVFFKDHPKGHNRMQDCYKDHKFAVVDPHPNSHVYNIKQGDGKGLVQSVKWHENQDLRYTLKEDGSSKDTKKEGKTKVTSDHPEVQLKNISDQPNTTCAKGQPPKTV